MSTAGSKLVAVLVAITVTLAILLGWALPMQSGHETMLVPIITYVPAGEELQILEQIKLTDEMPRCQDLPVVTDPWAMAGPVSCLLEVPR